MDLIPAEISYCIAIIPDNPFYNELITCNQHLTAQFRENKYELTHRFPPHITLFQGGTTTEGLGLLRKVISNTLSKLVNASLVADSMRAHENGFIEALCNLEAVQTDVLSLVIECAKVHKKINVYRPRIIEKFSEYSDVERESILQTGSARVGSLFKPHISIAQVASEHVSEATRIANKEISLPKAFSVSRVVMVDAGHKNEKWETIFEIMGT
jgi:2'-5' RNA ligase